MKQRDERFELRLSADEAEMLKTLANEDGVSAADYLRQLLRREWKTRSSLMFEQRLEMITMGTLTDLTTRPEVRTAVVFASNIEKRIWPPAKGPGPEPTVSNVMEIPFRAWVVGQGFPRTLDDAERRLVEARFPGASVTWSERFVGA